VIAPRRAVAAAAVRRRIAQLWYRRRAREAAPWSRADERPHDDTVSPEPWPTDAVARREWVAAMVREIDHRWSSGRYGLLPDLLRAAWPSWLAQDQ